MFASVNVRKNCNMQLLKITNKMILSNDKYILGRF